MRLVFTGDLSFSECFENDIDDAVFAPEIAEYLHDADHVIANVECAITDRAINSDRALNHASSPLAGELLARNNMKIWSLANNHITDCGEDGILDTLSAANRLQCSVIGAGRSLDEAAKPVILEGDCRVGILSVASNWTFLRQKMEHASVFTWNEKKLMSDRISQLKKEADWVILVAHGGDEFSDIALPDTRERYRSFLEMGADIVVAHHPHVVQNYECIGEKMIFYSLGNFVFDTDYQRKRVHTDKGILLGMNFSKDGFTFDACPLLIDRNQHRIEKTTAPEAFCQISDRDYQRLWPLVARIYYRINWEKRMIIDPKMIAMSPVQRVIHEIKKMKSKKQRLLFLGILRSWTGGWRFAENRDLLRYLQEAKKTNR